MIFRITFRELKKIIKENEIVEKVHQVGIFSVLDLNNKKSKIRLILILKEQNCFKNI